jgi:hypothetical protein
VNTLLSVFVKFCWKGRERGGCWIASYLECSEWDKTKNKIERKEKRRREG